jgi:hypothetical protein
MCVNVYKICLSVRPENQESLSRSLSQRSHPCLPVCLPLFSSITLVSLVFPSLSVSHLFFSCLLPLACPSTPVSTLSPASLSSPSYVVSPVPPRLSLSLCLLVYPFLPFVSPPSSLSSVSLLAQPLFFFVSPSYPLDFP